MKKVIINGIELNVSETEYKSYLAQTKAKKELEKNSNKLDAKTPTKSVSPTYSDYVLRALKAGAELLFHGDLVSVVKKGDVVIAEDRGFNKKTYFAIKKSIEEYNGKWCGDRDKKVFTYKFKTAEDGMKFVEAQKARG